MMLKGKLRRVIRRTDRLVRAAGSDPGRLAAAYESFTKRITALNRRHRARRPKDQHYLP
jgi:hypothetical protein